MFGYAKYITIALSLWLSFLLSPWLSLWLYIWLSLWLSLCGFLSLALLLSLAPFGFIWLCLAPSDILVRSGSEVKFINAVKVLPVV